MYHPRGDLGRLYVKKEKWRKRLVTNLKTYKAEIICIAENLNTKCKEDEVIKVL